MLIKNSIKGSMSHGMSAEDLRGSVGQPCLSKGSKKSPSNRTNLLKSVLSQNRDPENYDFSEILRNSPKQKMKKTGSFAKTGYASPKASKDKMMESTNSKKKKYGSIIV